VYWQYGSHWGCLPVFGEAIKGPAHCAWRTSGSLLTACQVGQFSYEPVTRF
jgi:hypothetical protein